MSDDYGGADVMPAPSASSSSSAAAFKIEEQELEIDSCIPEDERRFYLKAYPTVDLVKERRVHCTICRCHIGTAPCMESIIKMHPVLRVTHCTKCHDFYNSGEFSKGEDGSELYCRWCGQGGEVYCCSSCPYVFCKSCITKNLSKGVVSDIEQNENWNCFNCSTKILWPLRAQHWALVKYIEQQKKQIKEGGLSEAEVKKLMSEDHTTCCRLAKAKCGNMSDSVESIDSSTSRRSAGAGSTGGGGGSVKRTQKNPTPGISPAIKRLKTSNDEVVCEPDLLSMLEPDCQITESPKASRKVAAPGNSVPRIMTIQTNNATYNIHTSTPKSSVPPPLVLRNTSIKVNRAVPAPGQVVRQNVVGPRAPAPPVNPPTPVYHTINGFRIDLNSAAQHETFRLPNGKLIQVKRQGLPQQQQQQQQAHPQSQPSSSVAQALSAPGYHHQRPVAPQMAPRRIQVTATSNGPAHFQPMPVATHIQHPPQPQPQPQPAVIRYQNTLLTNTPQVAQNGIQTVQIVNGIPTAPVQAATAAAPAPQPTQSQPPRPQLVKHNFGDTPIGQARSQLQEQVFSAMEICQHLASKIHFLTNSNAYKTARNYLEVKELYIHMSYLLTYGIGRYKGLQEKCLADMRELGFVNDADCLENGQLAADKQASDDEDNEIEIVEPKTDTITLDSDDDDAPLVKSQPAASKSAPKPLPKTPSSITIQKVPAVNNPTNRIQPGPGRVVQIGRVQITPNTPGTQQPRQAPRLQIVQAQSLTGSNNVAIRQPPPLASSVQKILVNPSVSVKPATSTTISPSSKRFPQNLEFVTTAQNFLANILDVEVNETDNNGGNVSDNNSNSNPAPKSKKQPRKKTTNKPNPQLLQLERQRLEEMKRSDLKLKMKCKVSLTKAEYDHPDLIPLIQDVKNDKQKDKDKEKEEKTIDGKKLKENQASALGKEDLKQDEDKKEEMEVEEENVECIGETNEKRKSSEKKEDTSTEVKDENSSEKTEKADASSSDKQAANSSDKQSGNSLEKKAELSSEKKPELSSEKKAEIFSEKKAETKSEQKAITLDKKSTSNTLEKEADDSSLDKNTDDILEKELENSLEKAGDSLMEIEEEDEDALLKDDEENDDVLLGKEKEKERSISSSEESQKEKKTKGLLLEDEEEKQKENDSLSKEQKSSAAVDGAEAEDLEKISKPSKAMEIDEEIEKESIGKSQNKTDLNDEILEDKNKETDSLKELMDNDTEMYDLDEENPKELAKVIPEDKEKQVNGNKDKDVRNIVSKKSETKESSANEKSSVMNGSGNGKFKKINQEMEDNCKDASGKIGNDLNTNHIGDSIDETVVLKDSSELTSATKKKDEISLTSPPAGEILSK